MGTMQTGTLLTEQFRYFGVEIDLIYGVILGLIIYFLYTKLPE
jgi:tetrahydromethanopterin S-methyltransferase subunit G